ncbi:hypothetical protein ABIE37_000398 [Arthrobacter bambusae]|uniref:Uncharacterized protein n=1 Tax=Arthrobacter bambusae TaxID=1338426 RepID=A0ABV2P1K1_9MICC
MQELDQRDQASGPLEKYAPPKEQASWPHNPSALSASAWEGLSYSDGIACQ